MASCINFYPRSPCGERQHAREQAITAEQFLSTLSLRRATPRLSRVVPTPIFLSTLSLRRATRVRNLSRCLMIFLSTLSLRRATKSPANSGPCIRYFYPRSPCGERPPPYTVLAALDGFLSTLSLRRATAHFAQQIHKVGISIHALLAESDLFLRSGPMTRRYFYPRSPCGERRDKDQVIKCLAHISIHALLAESDHRSP